MREIKFRAWVESEQKIFEDMTYTKEYTEGIHPWIFMQYTGLHDKNGVECYEGDKIKYMDSVWENEAQMYFDQEAEGVVVFEKGMFKLENGDDCAVYLLGDFDIIGNIYENQELLTNKNS